jgi:hypothetical protein
MEPDDTSPPYSISLSVEIYLLPTAEGGVSSPVASGYRPLCQFTKPDGEVVTVGMCQLELAELEYLSPGGAANGFLHFAPGLEDLVRELATVSPVINLAEGRHVIGSATVKSIAGRPFRGRG